MHNTETKTQSQVRDDLIMYQFRTKLCNRKHRCKNPSNCFDAHSNTMKRRVPKQAGSKWGLFNYIPVSCQDYLSKKCRLGKSCPRSHGWLEVIFHPLLYKTKLCKSQRGKNGICKAHGVYCAKAHTRSEIRNLLEIYGEQWKRHYDLSHRLSRTMNDQFTIMPNFNMTKKCNSKMERVGLALVPKIRKILDVNLFAQNILDGHNSQLDHPPMCLEQTSPKAEFLDIQFEDLEYRDAGEKSQVGKIGSSLGSKEITDYTELYTHNPRLYDEHLRNGSLIDCKITMEQESGSYCTYSLMQDCLMATSRSPSFVYDDLENNLSLSAPDCDGHFFSDSDEESGSSPYRVYRNWFLQSCLDKASMEFEN